MLVKKNTTEPDQLILRIWDNKSQLMIETFSSFNSGQMNKYISKIAAEYNRGCDSIVEIPICFVPIQYAEHKLHRVYFLVQTA